MDSDEDLIKKAKNGDKNAQRALATLYELGIDRPADPQRAFLLWLKLAKSGDPHAQLTVSEMYEKGEGTKKDLKLAAHWKDLAAQKNVLPWHEGKGIKTVLVSQRKKALIVDDDPTSCKLLESVCLDQGLQSVIANSAKDALTMMTRHPDISIIFLDLVMPDMNGVQLLRTVRKMQILPDIPVLVVSGNIVKSVVSELKKLGTAGLIAKPVSEEILSTKIRHCLNLK